MIHKNISHRTFIKELDGSSYTCSQESPIRTVSTVSFTHAHARSERPFLIRMAKIPPIEIIDVIAMKKGQNMTGNSRV